jgi:thiol peroxidase
VTVQTVAPRSEITWVGKPSKLAGEGALRVGAKLPEASLVSLKMEPAVLGGTGRVRVIDTLPSLDTPVCDRQTHILGESTSLDPKIERITVSADLPYAQRRFADESKLQGITYLSDYRGGAFGRATGLQLERNGLLTRAVIVVDGEGVVRHLQIVPEILQLPDMAKAFAVANKLAQKEP